MAACARAEQIELGLLDAVLGLPAPAVQPIVERIGGKIEMGHDETGIGALRTEFQAGDESALDAPGVGAVAQLADCPLLRARRGVGRLQLGFPGCHRLMQAGVARHADRVADRVPLAPAPQRLATEAGIGAHHDARLRPGLA